MQLTYGEHPESDFYLVHYDQNSKTVTARVLGIELTYQLGASGRHMAINSLACLAIGKLSNIDYEMLRAGFLETRAQKGRGEILDIQVKNFNVRIFDETYNANPLSMHATLEMFAQIDVNSARKILVLGDMLELGDDAGSYHDQLLPLIIACRPDQVVLVGEYMARLQKGLDNEKISCAVYKNSELLRINFIDLLKANDSVLLKASNSIGLHKIVDDLVAINQNQTART